MPDDDEMQMVTVKITKAVLKQLKAKKAYPSEPLVGVIIRLLDKNGKK